MDFLKKHPFLVIYIILLIGAVVFHVGGGWILLGSLAYLLLVALIRLPNTIARIGYFLQGVGKKPEQAFFQCFCDLKEAVLRDSFRFRV